jgi:hypothetical protein
MAGVAVGGVVALEALFAGPVCVASMNPARSLAPTIVSGRLEHLWVYLAAPTLGACLAVGVGGCIHDAGYQQPVLRAGVAAVARAGVHQGDTGDDHSKSLWRAASAAERKRFIRVSCTRITRLRSSFSSS